MTACVQQMSWVEANQAALVAEFSRLRLMLDGERTTRPSSSSYGPVAIDRIAATFSLSPFERDLLLLCAGVEMDSTLAMHPAKGTGPVTFGLAMSVLDDPHWSALTPTRPLRRYRLLELEPHRGLSLAALRIDERVLHLLAGTNLLDTRLESLVRLVEEPADLAPSHREVARRVICSLVAEPATTIQLAGTDPQGQEDVAAAVASELGRLLLALSVEDLPAHGPDLDHILLLLEREILLLPALILLICPNGLTPAGRRLAERLPGPTVFASRDSEKLTRPVARFDVDKPEPAEQKHLWQRALGPEAESLTDAIDEVAQQFRLSTSAIVRIASAIPIEATPDDLWNHCRAVSRPQLESLARRIVSRAAWDDLILPAQQSRTLRQLVSQVRHRMQVYVDWGFAVKASRGLGVSALFSGESGTGKTLAAEVLANELRLDLYRIDLSSVVSKYIGETEKNLKLVFDAAEDGGVMLLFDEADALFGKRTEVKEGRDHFANIEVGYLLQRMETFQGLAILTTNLKSSLDRAFQRRLRFIVPFPFPDTCQREAIWRKAFPAALPTESLDYTRLAQLNIAGGNIRNIALSAAFLAAEQRRPVSMAHMLEAAHLEAQKIERSLSPAETRGWL